jgi:hypothetical protein
LLFSRHHSSEDFAPVFDDQRFSVHADENATAFVNLESRFDPAERREDCAASEIKLDKTVAVPDSVVSGLF